MTEENKEKMQMNKNLMMFLIFLLGFIIGILALWMTLQFGGLRNEGAASIFQPRYFYQYFIPTPPGGSYLSPYNLIPTPPGG